MSSTGASPKSHCSNRGSNLQVTIMDGKESCSRTVFNSLDNILISESLIDNLIREDMKCRICLGTIEKATITQCCLNRFCKECIYKFLQQLGQKPGQKRVCPMCKHTTNHRKLKSDDKMDELINLVAVQEEGQNQNSSDRVDLSLAKKKITS